MKRLTNMCLGLILVAFSACGGSDEGGGDGSGGDGEQEAPTPTPVPVPEYLFTNVEARCDPDYDIWDDWFFFEAETLEGLDEVSVDIYQSGVYTLTLKLAEASSGYWYAEIAADDIDSDCDYFETMLFDFQAEGLGTTDEATLSP